MSAHPAATAVARRFLAGSMLALTGILPVAHAAPETWRFDPLHSRIGFAADHQGFARALGHLRIKDGWFRFDPEDWSTASVDVTVDLASLDLGDASWNRAVLAGAWLDANRPPVARYASRRVEARGATHGVIHGELTLRGVTRPVTVEFTLNRIAHDRYALARKAGFSARAVLRRSEFGMDRFAEAVGEEVELRIEIEGVRERTANKPSIPAMETRHVDSQ